MINEEFKNEILEAYEITGLKPIRGDFDDRKLKNDKPNCACGIGAWLIKNNLDYRNYNGELRDLNVRFGSSFIDGFIAGFDGEHDDDYSLLCRDFANGYDTGKEAWDALQQQTV